MDMHTLIHPDRLRAPSATTVPPFQASGLRPHHLPSLPVRLAALHSAAAGANTANSAATTSNSTTSAATSNSGSASLTPLRFIIPSTHCPTGISTFAATTGATSSTTELTNTSSSSSSSSSAGGNTTVTIRPASTPQVIKTESMSMMPSLQGLHAQGNQELPLHHAHRPPPIEIAVSTMDNKAAMTLATVENGSKPKKSPGKRSRVVKNPNRSTKSKARPGLRKGKWTEEEERYATQLTNYFKEGLLPIERGTMLRLYLSQKLNCEPMRITKKFTGGECIGKQVFRPCSPTPEARVRLMQAQLELVALEAAFIKKLKENKEEVPGLTDDGEGGGPGIPGGLSATSSIKHKKRRPRKPAKSPAGGEDREDAGFTSDSSTSSEMAPGGRSLQRQASTGDIEGNVDGMDDAGAVGLLLDFFYKANRNGQSKQREPSATSAVAATATAEVSAPVVAEPEPEVEEEEIAALRVPDEIANSPTKRMRTLSISSYGPEVTEPKRSRVGSFSVASTAGSTSAVSCASASTPLSSS